MNPDCGEKEHHRVDTDLVHKSHLGGPCPGTASYDHLAGPRIEPLKVHPTILAIWLLSDIGEYVKTSEFHEHRLPSCEDKFLKQK